MDPNTVMLQYPNTDIVYHFRPFKRPSKLDQLQENWRKMGQCVDLFRRIIYERRISYDTYAAFFFISACCDTITVLLIIMRAFSLHYIQRNTYYLQKFIYV